MLSYTKLLNELGIIIALSIIMKYVYCNVKYMYCNVWIKIFNDFNICQDIKDIKDLTKMLVLCILWVMQDGDVLQEVYSE